jgi:hypothetical protein
MLTRFLRDRARWRLDSPGVNAVRAARSVVALLDTAICLEGLPDNHPDLEKLARAGCFRGGVFDPGEAGLAVVRGWELTDQPTIPHQDLLATLAFTVGPQVPGSAQVPPVPPGGVPQLPASAPVPPVPPEGVPHEAGRRNGAPIPSDPRRGLPRGGSLLARPRRRRVPLRGASRR